MTIADAYIYIDLMIDKANQPYFINSEKDIFLNLSITEFLNKRYALMRINQDYSEMTGARDSANQDSSALLTVAANYCEWNDERYHHLTFASLNGVECRIVSDDEMSALKTTNNPFKAISNDNPVCAITQQANEQRLYFEHNPLGGATPDFTDNDVFAIRWLKHLSVDYWERIPEQYQHDILNITVRKITGNIESSNYTVQANEEQQ